MGQVENRPTSIGLIIQEYRVVDTLPYVAACDAGTWHLMIYETDEVNSITPYRYSCRSWRHEGPCRVWKASQDFKRVTEALKVSTEWMFVTITFNQSEWWDWQAQYIEAGMCWSALRMNLLRRYGKFRYIQTWERHKKQGIHCHVMLLNSDMHEMAYANCDNGENLILSPIAVQSGFGRVCYAELMRMKSEENMAAYLVNCAQELVGAGGKDQVPFDAPSHFRRLRASRGTLPPILKSGKAGYMVFRPFPEWVESIEPAKTDGQG